MKNFVIGVVVGVVVSGLTALILIFAFIKLVGSFGERPVSVADASTLVFKLEGEVPEKSPPEIPLPLFQDQTPMTVEQIWDTFRKAAADSRIKGIIFEPRGLEMGWAKMQEIHDEILQFKKSGKPIISYLRGPSAREYYLAAATDKIFLAPEDSLDLKGLRVEAVFIKNTLDKLGIHADVIHAGKYKDAGDMLTQTSMTPETHEVLDQVLDQLYGNLIDTVAQGRKKQSDAVKAIIDQGPFMANEALANGLIDAFGYEDQAADDMKIRLKQTELTKLSARAYSKTPPLSGGVNRRIALVVGEGEITRGSGNSNSDDLGITAAGFTKLLKQVEDDSSIKGVIIRVDSPGGDGVASDDILHAAKNLSKKKPVVISMSDLAASGGYFISMTGDPIVAYPNTLTGSIGVIFARMSLHGLFDKIGVNKQMLKRGQFADLDSDDAPLNEGQRQKIAGQIDAFYKSFVSRVADGRKKSFEQIEPLSQGRVWMGAQAKQNGLVDELGGLDRAVELVRQRAHLAASDRITLVPYPGKRSIFDVLFGRSDDSNALESKLEQVLGNLPVAALAKGGFLKLMPYSISVK
ncbi:MAG TPA: signal peptide peptidase SppA [Bryobacteraceae bacterium]|jgi:protease-4|nr:signal peptide peptidase SppA [Bryobacteraceae bacterium]